MRKAGSRYGKITTASTLSISSRGKEVARGTIIGVFSQRSAIRLKRLILPIICSIRARALERTLAKNFGLSMVFER